MHEERGYCKRVAFLSAVTFLGQNGLDFVAPEEAVVEKMLALDSGALDEGARNP